MARRHPLVAVRADLRRLGFRVSTTPRGLVVDGTTLSGEPLETLPPIYSRRFAAVVRTTARSFNLRVRCTRDAIGRVRYAEVLR